MKITYKCDTFEIKWYQKDYWFFKLNLLKIRFAEWLYPSIKETNIPGWDDIKIED